MIDGLSIQLSFLIFEAIFCFLCALVYSVTRDPLRVRKSVVLSLNISCGFMLICECLFYVYKGATEPIDVMIMYVVNAAVYYLIVCMLLFYTMLVFLRLFGRFDLKPGMPCRGRLFAILGLILTEFAIITISQFTGILYYFDENNVYQRGPLFYISAVIPTIGAILVCSVIIQHREKTTAAQRLVLVSYLALPLCAEIFQMLFFGSSLMNISMGISVLLMFFENFLHKEQDLDRATKTEVRTGLANEHGYIDWLNSMKGKEELKDYSVVFFDLRKFADINRKYGIENGNRILANFGNIMLGRIGRDEILGRQFSNQFVAILKNGNLDAFVEGLQGVEVPFIDKATGRENKVTLTARIGIYKIDRSDLDGEDILVFAAQSLVAAKSRNSKDIVWLTQEMLDKQAERKKLEYEIKSGLANGEFRPYYQPKVDIHTGRLCGMEALARWMHGMVLVSPGVFIPIMESNDTITQLDLLMLKSVCADIKEWLDEGLEVPVISINFSRRNLADPELSDKIDKVVKASEIPQDRIEIEITETVDEFSIGDLQKFADELHKLGYKISIDDFGSASSSLSLLREVSFDTLKIDKGFIDHDKKKDLTILSNIIHLAKEIDLDIVAEGVELKNQIDVLNDLGVSVIQGYFFDKPLPKDEVTARLREPYYSKTS